MKIGILLGVGLLGCAAAGAADKVQPLNIKLGQWESTVRTVKTGPPPMSPETLAKMTPQQRATAERTMKAMMRPQPHIARRCVTQEDLAKSFGGYAEDSSCKRTIVTSTSSQQEFNIECTNHGILSTGTVHMDAIDPEHVNGKVNMSMDQGGQHRTVEMTINAKWVGAACPEKQ